MQEPPGPAPHDAAERAQSVPPPTATPPPATPPPATPPLETLKKRAEFLACARGRSAHTPGMVVQSRRRKSDDQGIRVGFTASRKVGKAVARNRARRRLREVARQVLPRRGCEGFDYVLIARSGTTEARPFTRLVADLEQALDRLHGKKDA